MDARTNTNPNTNPNPNPNPNTNIEHTLMNSNIEQMRQLRVT